jgi:hypothetical protein
MFAGCVTLQRKEEEKGVFCMKNLILALAVLLLAAPVWADVTITLEDLGEGKIAVNYDATSEAGLVRAFALDISATDGNIIDINDFAIGDDNGGFGIFPGTFAAANVVVNPGTGQVDNWAVDGYSPVAPAGDPDALGDIPGPGITVEMGSLYDTAAPAKSGLLCTITVDGNVTQVCVAGNAIRGNVVLETAAEATLVLGDCLPMGSPDCILPGHPDYDEWVGMGKPECWCNKRQCYGDADGEKEGGAKTGFFYVHYDDLGVLLAAWNVKEPTKGPGIGTVTGPGPKFTPGICADFARDQEGGAKTGYFRVHYNDLGILMANWNVKEPTKGPGIPEDCQ